MARVVAGIGGGSHTQVTSGRSRHHLIPQPCARSTCQCPRTGFAGVARDLELAAAVDGASPWAAFWRITVPLAFPSLLTGAVLCWSRALGVFGATIMFAGSFRGRTQTMPLASYAFLENDLGAALALGLILVAMSALALGLIRWVTREREAEAKANKAPVAGN